jgi:hypothetical protein
LCREKERKKERSTTNLNVRVCRNKMYFYVPKLSKQFSNSHKCVIIALYL